MHENRLFSVGFDFTNLLLNFSGNDIPYLMYSLSYFTILSIGKFNGMFVCLNLWVNIKAMCTLSFLCSPSNSQKQTVKKMMKSDQLRMCRSHKMVKLFKIDRDRERDRER